VPQHNFENTAIPPEDEPFFFYVLEVQDREFPITLALDGISQWDEHTERRKVRPTHQRDLELQAFAGNREALKLLLNELLEFTVTVPVSKEIYSKATEMVEKQKRNEPLHEDSHEITWEAAKDIIEMDQLLREFFWANVNPLLSRSLLQMVQ
jgi:hypothetical protein